MSNITVTSEVNVYKTRPEGGYPLAESDWTRLKDLIQKIVPEKKVYSILASILGGVFVSSAFFLFSLLANTNETSMPPQWILNVGWILFISSLIVCIAFLLIDNQQKRLIVVSKDFVIEEMNKIENKFDKTIL
jgi:protein-S-isoprenylcysteine O-methyltransferase Ste14